MRFSPDPSLEGGAQGGGRHQRPAGEVSDATRRPFEDRRCCHGRAEETRRGAVCQPGLAEAAEDAAGLPASLEQGSSRRGPVAPDEPGVVQEEVQYDGEDAAQRGHLLEVQVEGSAVPRGRTLVSTADHAALHGADGPGPGVQAPLADGEIAPAVDAGFTRSRIRLEADAALQGGGSCGFGRRDVFEGVRGLPMSQVYRPT